MKPLPRNILIGLVVSACVVGALVATWWTTARGRPAEESLAKRLPADAVLAYVNLPEGDLTMLAAFQNLVPSLELPREISNEATSLAAVRSADGAEGWIASTRSPDGVTHITGSNPALEPLLAQENAQTLASDDTFQALRFTAGTPWAYVSFPTVSRAGSALPPVLALDAPASFAVTASGTTLRLSLRPAPALVPWSGKPLSVIENADVILLPPSASLPRLGTLLSKDALLVAETFASTFLDDVAPGTSLRYDMPALLDGPSMLQMGVNGSGDTVFSLEGRGSNSTDTERILRRVHEKFASSRGGSHLKTLMAEGYSLTTITPEGGADTVETQEGAWTIVRTDSLVSAQDGTRFVITTAPQTLAPLADDAPMNQTMPPSKAYSISLSWTQDLAARIHPLWPTLKPLGDRLEFSVSQGPGYVEWQLGRLKSL